MHEVDGGVPVVWSPATRLHDPRHEVWVGVATDGTDVAARVDVILEALRDGHVPTRRGEHRPHRHARGGARRGDARVPAHVVRALDAGPVRSARRPGPRRAVPLPDPGDDRRPPDPACGRRARGCRPVRLRHDDAGRPGHLGGGRPPPQRAPPRPLLWSAAARLSRMRCAALRVTTRRGRASAVPATSTTPRWPPRRCSRTGTTRWRSSTSTRTTATAPKRSSTSAATCCTARCTSTRGPAGSRTSWGTPTRPAIGGGAGATRNLPLAEGTGDGPWLDAVQGLAAWATTAGCTALVVSLGVDAAADDPESPLLVTADGYRGAGRILGGDRPPDRGRPGGRLPPPDARGPGRGVPRRAHARLRCLVKAPHGQ